jgi:hypothetical protein
VPIFSAAIAIFLLRLLAVRVQPLQLGCVAVHVLARALLALELLIALPVHSWYPDTSPRLDDDTCFVVHVAAVLLAVAISIVAITCCCPFSTPALSRNVANATQNCAVFDDIHLDRHDMLTEVAAL